MAFNQPTIFQISRAGFFFFLVFVAGLMALSGFLASKVGPDHPFLPLTPYLAYIVLGFGPRKLFTKHHRRGCRAFHQGDPEAAIAHMEASYAFLQRHAWIDRFRFLTMLSVSAMSYRELALLNIAFFQTQLGRKDEATAAYHRVVAEFPGSLVGKQTLKMIETFETPGTA